MKYLNLFQLTLLVFSFGCSDEFNDPNPEGGEIIDSIQPTMQIYSPVKDSTYVGLDTIPVRIDFEDDFALESCQILMGATNVGADELKFTKFTEDTVYRMDTFYPIPAIDTMNMNIIIRVRDYAGNERTENYNFNLHKQ